MRERERVSECERERHTHPMIGHGVISPTLKAVDGADGVDIDGDSSVGDGVVFICSFFNLDVFVGFGALAVFDFGFVFVLGCVWLFHTPPT